MFARKYVYLMAHHEILWALKAPSPTDAENVWSCLRRFDYISKKMSSAEHDAKEVESMVVPTVIASMTGKMRAEWSKLQQGDIPPVGAILEFLHEYAEKIDHREEPTTSMSRTRPTRNEDERPLCHHCGEQHPLFTCTEFLKMSVHSRQLKVSELKLCANCLSAGHLSNSEQCAAGTCSRCQSGKRHNSKLCFY